MSLLVRLILTLVRAGTSARLDPLELSVVRFRVWPNDLDLNGHMNNGRYLTLMDLGRLDLMARMGLVREAIARKWAPIVAGVSIHFRRPLAPFDSYELKTQVLGWNDKWFFLEQRFEKDGQLVAKATVKAVLVHGRRTVPSTEVIEALGASVESPPLPDHVLDWADGARASRPFRERLGISTDN